MELLNILSQVPLPVLFLVAALLIIITLVITYKWFKAKGLEGVRKQVYSLYLKAEHMYESGQGKQKLKWVVSQARSLLPLWLQWITSDEILMNIIDAWFKEIKDLLDDGKLNDSQGA